MKWRLQSGGAKEQEESVERFRFLFLAKQNTTQAMIPKTSITINNMTRDITASVVNNRVRFCVVPAVG